MKKKTWKNDGNIMEFCQSKKVGTLVILNRMASVLRTHLLLAGVKIANAQM